MSRRIVVALIALPVLIGIGIVTIRGPYVQSKTADSTATQISVSLDEVTKTVLEEMSSSWPTLPVEVRRSICSDFTEDPKGVASTLAGEYAASYEERTGWAPADNTFSSVLTSGYQDFLGEACKVVN